MKIILGKKDISILKKKWIAQVQSTILNFTDDDVQSLISKGKRIQINITMSAERSWLNNK